MSDNGHNCDFSTSAEQEQSQNGFDVLPENIEIYNMYSPNNHSINIRENSVENISESQPEEKGFIF